MHRHFRNRHRRNRQHTPWTSIAWRIVLLALAVCLLPTAASAAGLGDECRTGFNVPQQYLCTGATSCIQGIDKKYCSSIGKACGWPGTGGYNLGQKKTYQGKSYECTSTGFKRSMAARGEECRVGSSVPRQYLCQPGLFCLNAIDTMYCSNAGRVCGWQGTGGYALGYEKNHQGNTYSCTVTGFEKKVESVSVGGGSGTAIPTKPQARNLTSSEIRVARSVFGSSINYGMVRVTNTLGAQHRPWTTNTPPIYTINVGVVAYKDLSNRTWSGLLIHELTHVWQGQHGMPFMSNSAWHQTMSAIQNGGDTGQAYDYTKGKQWKSYNAEQQASIAEDWYTSGRSRSSELYPYIRDNLMRGDPNATTSSR